VPAISSQALYRLVVRQWRLSHRHGSWAPRPPTLVDGLLSSVSHPHEPSNTHAGVKPTSFAAYSSKGLGLHTAARGLQHQLT
jgi:hypothetical protein